MLCNVVYQPYVAQMKIISMAGIELILGTICNVTSCASDPFFPPIVQEGVSPDKRDLEMKTLRNMVNGNHFRVATIRDGLRSGFAIHDDGRIIGRGVAFDIMKELSETFNFSYEIVLPPSHISKDIKQLHSWLVSMLINHKIDIAPAFVPFTMDLKHMITFSLEVDTINCLKEPNSFNSRRKTLYKLQPFQGDVWCFFLLTLLAYLASLVLLTRLRSKLMSDDEEPFTLSSSVRFVLTKPNVQELPKASMTRILIITWLLCVTLMTTYYTANLSKGLTLRAVAREQVLKEDAELSWLVDSGIPMNFSSLSDCYFNIALDRFLKRPSGFAYPRNSSLNILFGHHLKIMFDRGFLDYIHRFYKRIADKVCLAKVYDEGHQLNVRNLAVVYYCWIAGIVAAFAVFIAELLLNKLRKPTETCILQTSSEETNDVSVELHDFSFSHPLSNILEPTELVVAEENSEL